MKIEEVFESDVSKFEKELAVELMGANLCESHSEAMVLVEDVKNTIRTKIKEYRGNKPPVAIPLQSKKDPKEVVLFLAGEGEFYKIDIYNSRVVNEERLSNWAELQEEKRVLELDEYAPVDTQGWLSKNWRTVVKWIATGVLGAGVVTLLAASLVVIAPFVKVLAGWLIIGGLAGSLLWVRDNVKTAIQRVA